ncbi:hypothetical protein NIES2104_21000 [Leptolyngbya sp. NIES-2104]|nr:hypothetical protein NIES2104_21000 [Leptolyngbya sp. NIES-2104]
MSFARSLDLGGREMPLYRVKRYKVKSIDELKIRVAAFSKIEK